MSLSAPNVMSNFPRVSALASAASRSTAIVSSLTDTALMPAFRFIRMTSLLSFQTLSSASSRSNSAKTSSKALTAPGSSAVHAASRSWEPIDTRARSMSAGGAGPEAHAAHISKTSMLKR